MDPIRTLLLARTHTVILDPDRVASASTRPARDGDVDRFEDELVQLGFVMSLDLAMTIRRLPHETIKELRTWMVTTLSVAFGAHRPHVPPFHGPPATTPADAPTLFARRVVTWLVTRPDQPCPWCGQIKPVGALDPCGHLVCRECWAGGTYAGCPICHRRVSPSSSFIAIPEPPPAEPILRHDGHLHVLHLAFDVTASARARFERLIGRTAPLSKADRTELETVIDAMGPKVALWLPPRIPVKETMAIAIARLWFVAPDRSAMVRATQGHLRTGTDVLRVAAVLMHGDPGLAEPMRLRSIGRGLRRAVLEALDRLAAVHLVEDVRRHPGLWKRIGERLHPFELAAKLPTAALAFAAIRGTSLATASFGAAMRERAATIASVRIADDRLRVTPWSGAVESALRAGEVRAATARLAGRPGELLRRADHLVRVTAARQPDALGEVLVAIEAAIGHGAADLLLTLAAHVAARGGPWRRRVMVRNGDALRAWSMADRRPPLQSDAIGAISDAVRRELVARAETRPRFARAVIDRGLADLAVPTGARIGARAKIAWPRGTEVAIASDDPLRLFLHWEEPPGARLDLDLAVALYDAGWRHVGTCDATNPVVVDRGAVHGGDRTSAPPPRGASEFVDLQVAPLAARGARHAVMIVFGDPAVAFDPLSFAFAGVAPSPAAGEPFDPRAVAQRFDLRGRAPTSVPLTIDLETRRLRWIDVRVRDRRGFHDVGGVRAALARLGRDFEDQRASAARPTLWQLAAVHATARANVVYVRGPDAITTYRRRDGETTTARLARLLAGDHDGIVPTVPAANAPPTWVALIRDDLAIPSGSAGYILDARATGPGFTRLDAAALLAELSPR